MDIVKAILLVIAGSVVLQAIGALWYGPLFGKKWMDSWGKKSADLKMTADESRRVYGGSFIAGLVVCAFLYMIANVAMATNPGSSPLTIGLSAVIFTAVIAGFASLPAYLFEKRPIMMWGIHYSYMALSYGLISFIYACFA